MRTSISTRLILPFALFLAPIAFLLYFLVETHHKGIQTARNELAGVPVVTAALKASKTLLQSIGSNPADRMPLQESLDNLKNALKPWATDPTIATKSEDLFEALDKLVKLKTISVVDTRIPLDTLANMIRLIGDASELILDPDLDTYYAMDMIVVLAPEIMAAKQKMLTDRFSMELQKEMGGFTRDLSFLYAQIFQSLNSRLNISMQNVKRHTHDPRIAEKMQQNILTYNDVLENIHGLDASNYGYNEAFSYISSSLNVQEEWYNEAASILSSLLEQRNKLHQRERNQQIIIALLMFVVASIALVALTRQYIILPLRNLTDSMMRLASGSVDTALPQAPNETEVADMVQAVAVFKENAIRNQILEAEKRQASVALNLTALTLQRAEVIAELGNWRLDMQTGRVNWSPNLFAIAGFDQAIGVPALHRMFARVPRKERRKLAGYLRSVFLHHQVGDYSCQFQHPNYGMRYFQSQIAIERSSDGTVAALMGIVQDISDIREHEIKLQTRTEALAEAQYIGRIGNWSYQMGASHLEWSPEIYRLLGYDSDAFVPTQKAVLELYDGDGGKRVLAAQAEAMRTGSTRSVDVGVRCGDGKVADFTVTSKADINADGELTGFSGTIQDISARKQAERELEKLAFYDPLTGLANRALFQRALRRELEQCLESKESSALFLMDLDKFKEVNDSLGHAAGDELLVRVAERLRRELPQSAFLARLGGDEFAVVLSGVDEDAARAFAEKIVMFLAEPVALRLGDVQIGTSIGMAMMPKDGQQPEMLVRHADLALYNAKDAGRSCARFFTAQLSEAVQEKTAIARDLKKALGFDDQLYVVFQPQVDIQHGKVTGFEALLRWRHPERGNVPPSVFIPIAESSSLISDLGLYVLWASCRQMKDWIDAGHPPRDVAVNVSPTQIWQSDFEQDVKQVLMDTELPPHLLTLEVTESVFLREAEGRVRQALDGLKALGIKLALDDFGTGYSSLGYLNRLPFDKLKIDRRFIAGVHRNPSRMNLLKGIIELGLGLGMTTVAEGAEQIEEVRALRQLNCHLVQGYIFSHPLEGDSAVRSAALLDLMVPGRETIEAAQKAA